MLKLKVVSAVLKRLDGKVLLAQRPKGKELAGFWEFPGGKIELGEADEAALGRELKEEIGVDVSAADLSFIHQFENVYNQKNVDITFYLCQKWHGDPVGLEGQNLAWHHLDELSGIKMIPGNEFLFPYLF